MNSLVLLIICVAILAAGYICYGGWLCKQWGVGESKTETPAHTMEDGVDYVPAKAPVLMGHHFSSIAGAGPITGPIGAAMFGWAACNSVDPDRRNLLRRRSRFWCTVRFCS